MSVVVVIEGPDRVGKATQTKLLKDSLEAMGKKVHAIEVPIRSNIAYHLIYWMLGNGLAKKLPKLFQWMQYMNRKIFEQSELIDLETKYDYIVADRWSLSSVVYGDAFGLKRSFTEFLYDNQRRPDFTVILLGPAHQHEAEDVYETDALLQRNVRSIYAKWAEERPGTTTLIDCTLPREAIAEEIISCLKDVQLL